MFKWLSLSLLETIGILIVFLADWRIGIATLIFGFVDFMRKGYVKVIREDVKKFLETKG